MNTKVKINKNSLKAFKKYLTNKLTNLTYYQYLQASLSAGINLISVTLLSESSSSLELASFSSSAPEAEYLMREATATYNAFQIGVCLHSSYTFDFIPILPHSGNDDNSTHIQLFLCAQCLIVAEKVHVVFNS